MAEELSNHIPFWTGEGYCLKGDLSTPRKERYQKKQFEVNIPEPAEVTASSTAGSNKEPFAQMGKVITKKAANAMIIDFIHQLGEKAIELVKKSSEDLNKNTSEIDRAKNTFNSLSPLVPQHVIFGKEAILSLLSQPNCEAIKFYFCIGPNDNNSLVLVGIGKDGIELGTDRTIFNCDEINEPDMKDSDQSTTKSILRQDTLLREVGGTDGKMIKNVKTVQEFLASDEGKACCSLLENKLGFNPC